MDDDVGAHARDRLVHLVAVGDVQVGVGGGDHLVALRGAVGVQVAAELAAGAGDEDLHRAVTARPAP